MKKGLVEDLNTCDELGRFIIHLASHHRLQGHSNKEQNSRRPILLLLLIRSTNHFPQFELLSELARQDTQVLDQVVAGGDYSFFGGDVAVCLYAQFEFRYQRVRNLMRDVSSLRIQAGQRVFTDVWWCRAERTLYPAKRTCELCSRRARIILASV